MSSLGTPRRLRRLRGPQGRFFLLALDHGLPAGPLPGIENPAALLLDLRGAPITGAIVNPGMVGHIPEDSPGGLVVHVSAGTFLGSAPTSKVLVSSVERALGLGADAVSVQVHFGDPEEERMLSDAGSVVDAASRFGLPVLVMAHPPGTLPGRADHESTRHAARAAAELGADVVQVPHPGDEDRVRAIVRGCPAPVVIAGGARSASPDAFLDSVRTALAGGAAGMSVGRNLFQHPEPASFARRIGAILFGESALIPVPEA